MTQPKETPDMCRPLLTVEKPATAISLATVFIVAVIA